MSGNAHLAGEAGRCVLCGDASIFCLCTTCRREWAPDGILPAWLRAFRTPTLTTTSAMRRNRERIARGPRSNTRGQRGGARYAPGVEIVSLDALAEGRLERLC